jgi:hypothetical protein
MFMATVLLSVLSDLRDEEPPLVTESLGCRYLVRAGEVAEPARRYAAVATALLHFKERMP